MAFGTGWPTSDQRSRSIAPKNVRAMIDGLEMVRANTGPVTAEVIDLHSLGQLADEGDVCQSVSPNG